MAQYLNRILIVTIIATISGCASQVTVNVNSIVDPSIKDAGKNYVLTSGLPDREKDDLYFREFRRYFDHILQKKGYTKVTERTLADIEILFKFGISDGRTGLYTYSMPIYDHVGGETITITEPANDGSGKTKVTTIHIPGRFERVGTSIETQSYTMFNRSAHLEARLINKAGDTKRGSLLWQTNIHSIGESNDLRAIMPYLAAAAEPYLGVNSGEQRVITLKRQAPNVLELKRLGEGTR